MRKHILFFLICSLLILLMGCSSNPQPQQSSTSTPSTTEVVKKEAILYTGKPCVNRMVEQARRWSADAMPLHVESKINAESVGHDGKSTIWSGTFLSPSKATARIFTCSGSVLPDEPGQGVSASPEMTASTAVPVFDPSLLGIDTDTAFNTAQEKGGSKLL